MTHVATAALEVSSPKTPRAPVVLMNRATELRIQKQRSMFANSDKSVNNSIVTWRVSSQKSVVPPNSNTSPAHGTPANQRQIQRNNTFTQSKNVNANIKNIMATFEPNQLNITVSTGVKKTVSLKHVNSVETITPISVNGVKKAEKVINKSNNQKVNILDLNEKSMEPTFLIKQNGTAPLKTDKLSKVSNDSVWIEKSTLVAKENGTGVPKTEQKYRTVNVGLRAPVVNISLTPWTSSGRVVTDADSKQVQDILEKRRKLIEQSSIEMAPVDEHQRQEPTSSPEIVVELRPASLDSIDESIRESSGASLDVNFPKAIDLARHQQKPLWRDIRGVQEANILENLTKEGRIRQEAKFELMLSEASYLHNLNMLKGHYMKNIEKHIASHVLTQEDYDMLFKNVLGVHACSRSFLEALDEVWQEDPMLEGIYDVIRTHTTDNFTAYVQYCRNILDMSNHLAELISKNQQFKTLLDVLINREGAQRLTLDAFLTSPMQRITKLPLLMKTIMEKCEDGSDEFKKCCAAYDATYKIALECDTVVNEKKRMEELLRLGQELEFADECRSIPLVAPNRHVVGRANVKHFAFRDRTTKKEKLQLILLSDILLVTKRKSDKLYIVVDHCSKNLLIVKEVDNSTLYGESENNKQLKPVVVTLLSNNKGKKLDLVVTFKDQAQCKEWLQMFVNSDEAETEGNQVVALEDHEPENEEQLALSPGMIIQITGPETDGWCEGEVVSDGASGLFPLVKTAKIVTSKSKNSHVKSKKELTSSSEFDANRKSDDLSMSPPPSETEDGPADALFVNSDVADNKQESFD